MYRIWLALIVTFSSIGCSTLDDTNPKEVITKYISLGFEYNYENRYDLLSAVSKETCSKGEYLKYYEREDSLRNFEQEILNIEELEEDQNYPSFKRFLVKVKTVDHLKDTLINKWYWTLRNDDGKWRIVWTHTLNQQASQKFDDSDFEGAIKLFERSIEIDPFSGDSYGGIGWCYTRDQSKSLAERKENSLKNFTYAVTLEPELPRHFNSLAVYYQLANIPELQIENYKKAISISSNIKETDFLYANMAITYASMGEMDDAEVSVRKAIDIDSSATFNWYVLGNLELYNQEFDNAKECYEKALNLNKMDNYLQAMLYNQYTSVCIELKEYENAKKYILMGLELDPSNEYAIELYRKLKEIKEE